MKISNYLSCLEKSNKNLPYLRHSLFPSDTPVLKMNVQFHRQWFLSASKKKVASFVSRPSAAHDKKLATFCSVQIAKKSGYVVLIRYHCCAILFTKRQINRKFVLIPTILQKYKNNYYYLNVGVKAEHRS